MQKARPKKKKGHDEIYKDDLMYQMFGEKYLAIKKHDKFNTKPSVDNSKVPGFTEPRPVRVVRSINTLPGYSM